MVAHALDEEAIFHVARKIDSADAREAYLRQVCEGNELLRARVEALLKVHEQEKSFLQSPASPSLATIDEPKITESPGTVIGPYKLLQEIGEGGMGVVFMAEQTHPVQRKVALKIIKPGMDSRQVIARFEAERQALALMDHPNIAKVLDAGTTGGNPKSETRNPKQIQSTKSKNQNESAQSDSAVSDIRASDLDIVSDFGFRASDFPSSGGRPYFVMELVKGIPITKYCDDNHLTPRERLELFIPVCHAVQHAHQKGIIHRDIKPSNVLVALYDGRPVPKVIDFGVAKATSQKLTERTMFTQFGQIVGTLEYMSPEQADLNQLDIDTRSDIYSLGVLLYELLTGTTPFERKRLREAAFDELLRIIREEEPPKPSTRLSKLSRSPLPSQTHPARQAGTTPAAFDSTLDSIAARRSTDPAALPRLIHGELDWIVMKALGKDRDRRYETARDLAMDIERYLVDKPVAACPPSAAYRFRKFAKRNKAAFSVAGLVLFLLALLGSAAGWAVRERDRAEQQRALTAQRERVIEHVAQAGRLKQAYQSCMAGDVRAAKDLLKSLEPAAGQPDDRSFLGHYLDRVCRTEPDEATLTGHAGPVYRATFSPDGKRLATGGVDKKIIIWDVASRQKLTVLHSQLSDVDTISFSLDGTTMVAAGCDGNIEFWDIATERITGIHRAHNRNAGAIFSPDGRLVASTGHDDERKHVDGPMLESIRLWDPATQEVIGTLTGRDGPVNSMAFSPDGGHLASKGHTSTTIWDTRALVAKLVIPRMRHGGCLAYSHDGQTLAVGAGDIRFWDAATGGLRGVTQQIAGGERLNSVRFSPDDSLLAATYEDGLVRLWNVASGRPRNLLRGHTKRAWSAAFSPGGELLATASDDSTVRLWPVASRQEYAELPTHAEPYRHAAFSPDGSLLALTDGHNTSLLLDPATLKIDFEWADGSSARPGQAGPHAIFAQAFTADSEHLVMVNGTDETAVGRGWRWNTIVQNVRTGNYRSTVDGSGGRPLAAISPDGRRLLVAGDGTVRIFDVADGRQLFIDQSYVGDNGVGVFSPDGNRVAIPSSRTVLDLATLESRTILPSGIPSLAWSPDGKTIAAGFGPRRLELIDTATGEILAHGHNHEHGISAIAFSPDGLTMATGSDDRTVRIWDVRARQELATLEGHTGTIQCLAFSPDSKTLVTSAQRPDGQSEVLIWPPPERSIFNRMTTP